MLSSTGYKDQDASLHIDLMDLKGHKLTFAQKEVFVKK